MKEVSLVLFFSTIIQKFMHNFDLDEGGKKCFSIAFPITISVKDDWRMSFNTFVGLDIVFVSALREKEGSMIGPESKLVAVMDKTNGIFYNFSKYTMFFDGVDKSFYANMEKFMLSREHIKAYESLFLSPDDNDSERFKRGISNWLTLMKR